MTNQYENLLDALSNLNTRGFNRNFSLTPSGLYCPVLQKTFSASECKIIEFHRFEGDTDMTDMAIIYAIQAGDCKGVLIDAFGTYSNSDFGDFLREIKNPT